MQSEKSGSLKSVGSDPIEKVAGFHVIPSTEYSKLFGQLQLSNTLIINDLSPTAKHSVVIDPVTQI
jgi:hypothetical protein